MSVRVWARTLVLLCFVLLLTPQSAFANQGAHTISVTPNLGGIVVNVSLPMTVTLSQAPASDLTVQLNLGGTVGSEVTLTPSSVTFLAGEVSKSFTLKAGPNYGTVTLSYTLSGTDAGSYLVPAGLNFNVVAGVTTSGVPLTMFAGQTSVPATISLTNPAVSGLTVTIGLSGTAVTGSSVNPSSLSFAPGQTTATFQTTTGPSAGSLTLTYTISGADSSLFRGPAPRTITVSLPNTPVGFEVSVTPVPSSPMPVSATVTWAQVTNAGQTSLFSATSVPAPPSGLTTVGSGIAFSTTTTATVTGTHQLCVTYANGIVADETALRLYQRTGPTQWTDRTATVDPAANVICGTFAGSAGQFALFTMNAPPEVDDITGPSLVTAGDSASFTATFSDPDAGDVHTGTWMWGDGNQSPATIALVDGVWTATGSHAFAAGTYQIWLVINDGGQSAASEDFEVKADGAPPVITSISASPESLWPPDSRMHEVVLTVVATDDTGVPVCEITGVTAEAKNVGQTAFNVTGALTVQLKAFPLTTYSIAVTCSDGAGRTTTGSTSVSVSK